MNALLNPWHLGFDALVLVSVILYVIYTKRKKQ